MENCSKFNSLPQQSDPINGPMVVHFLDRWLQQPSHPIVFVDFDPRLGQVCLSQTPKMEVPNKVQRWPIPVWVECLEGSMPEQLLWIPDDGELGNQIFLCKLWKDQGQLVLPLDALTRTNSTHSLAFNRNRAVYYQLSIRNRRFIEKFAEDSTIFLWFSNSFLQDFCKFRSNSQ